MQSVFTDIIDALKQGFGIAGDFGKMIQDTFTAVFLQTSTDATTGVVTITGLSAFGAVALALVGISVVTGLGMMIFRRFFKRS